MANNFHDATRVPVPGQNTAGKREMFKHDNLSCNNSSSRSSATKNASSESFPPTLGFMANLGRLGGIPRVGDSPREHAGMLNNGARNIYMSAGCTLSRAKLQCAVMMRNKIKNSHAGFGPRRSRGQWTEYMNSPGESACIPSGANSPSAARRNLG